MPNSILDSDFSYQQRGLDASVFYKQWGFVGRVYLAPDMRSGVSKWYLAIQSKAPIVCDAGSCEGAVQEFAKEWRRVNRKYKPIPVLSV